jgi:hypothetical protein
VSNDDQGEWLPELPPLPVDNLEDSDRNLAVPADRDTRTSDPKFKWFKVLAVLFVLCLALAAGGFFLPWVTVERGSLGAPSYSAIDLPIGNDLGLAWLAFLILLALGGWFRRHRWVLIVGSLCSVATAVVLGVTAVLLHIAPRLVPLWLVPGSARRFVPDIGTGLGPNLAFVSAGLLVIWFALAAVVRPAPTPNHEAGRLDSAVHRFEVRWAQAWKWLMVKRSPH